MNLKKALKNNELDKFIKERQKEKGDKQKFDSTLSSMAGKPKEVQKSSSQDKNEN